MLRLILVAAALLVASAPLRAEVFKVDVARLEPLREKGVPVIDIRTPEEWNHTGVIEGSHLLTFAEARGPLRSRRDGRRLLAAVARSGRTGCAHLLEVEGEAASQAAFWTAQFGYEQVFNVSGGMEQLIAEDRATVRP